MTQEEIIAERQRLHFELETAQQLWTQAMRGLIELQNMCPHPKKKSFILYDRMHFFCDDCGLP